METRSEQHRAATLKLMASVIQKLQSHASDSKPDKKLHESCMDAERAFHTCWQILNDPKNPAPATPALENFYFQAAQFFVAYLQFLKKHFVNQQLSFHVKTITQMDHEFALAYEGKDGLKTHLVNCLKNAGTLLSSAHQQDAKNLLTELDQLLKNRTLLIKRKKPVKEYAGQANTTEAKRHFTLTPQELSVAQTKFINFVLSIQAEQRIVAEKLAEELEKDPVFSRAAIQALKKTADGYAACNFEEIKKSIVESVYQQRAFPSELKQPVRQDPEEMSDYFRHEWDDRVTVMKKENCLAVIKKIAGMIHPQNEAMQQAFFKTFARDYVVFINLIEHKSFCQKQINLQAIADYFSQLLPKRKAELVNHLKRKIGLDEARIFAEKIEQLALDEKPTEKESKKPQPSKIKKSETEILLAGATPQQIKNFQASIQAPAFSEKRSSSRNKKPVTQYSGTLFNGKKDKRGEKRPASAADCKDMPAAKRRRFNPA